MLCVLFALHTRVRAGFVVITAMYGTTLSVVIFRCLIMLNSKI